MRRFLKLPAPPALVLKLVELSGSEVLTFTSLEKCISLDPACAGAVLKVANSAFYARNRPLTELQGALRNLGLETSLVVAMGAVLANSIGEAGHRRLQFRCAWHEALLRAFLARSVAQVVRPSAMGEAYLVGLLLDVGVLALLANVRGYECFLQAADGDRIILREMEDDALGINHLQATNMILEEWQLPEKLSKPLRSDFGLEGGSQPRPVRDQGEFLGQLAYLLRRTPVVQDPRCEHVDPNLMEYVGEVFNLSQDQLDDAMQVAVFEYASSMTVLERTLPRRVDPAADLKRLREAIVHAAHSKAWLTRATVLLISDSGSEEEPIETMLRRLGVRHLHIVKDRLTALAMSGEFDIDLVVVAAPGDDGDCIAVLPSLAKLQDEGWAQGIDSRARLGEDSLWCAIHNLHRRTHPQPGAARS